MRNNGEKIILKMVDGGLIDYSDDTWHMPGCPTCDYGSQYINDINIDLKRHSIHIELTQASQGIILALM